MSTSRRDFIAGALMLGTGTAAIGARAVTTCGASRVQVGI